MKNNTPNEYRTGGHLPIQRSGSLLAVGFLIFAAVTTMFITTGFLALRGDPFTEDKELAVLNIPDSTRYPNEEPHMEGEVTTCSAIGITCQSISAFCEKYYKLPAGIYILQVKKGSPADQQGVLPGDVLVRVNGEALRQPHRLQWFLDNTPNDALVEMEFSRNGKHYTIYVIPGA